MSCGATLAQNDVEQMVQVLIMICYALLLSYCISVIGQIVSAEDKSEAAFREKLEILDRIHMDCYLPLELYTKLK